VSDQDLVLDAVEEAQRILAEHIEPGSRRNPEATINVLLFLLAGATWRPLSGVCGADLGCVW